MEERIISVCGLVCSDCDAYKATQAGDEAWKERVAATWREMYRNPAIDVIAVTCDSCLATSGRLGGHCLECSIRACGLRHGVASCAWCPEFDGCAEIHDFMQFAPEVKEVLFELRG